MPHLRNSIAHGFSLPTGLSDDIPFRIVAKLSTTAVLQLALLRQAGYRNAMSLAPGELLWSGDRHAFSHSNSPVAKGLEGLGHHSDQWQGWYRRNQQPRQN